MVVDKAVAFGFISQNNKSENRLKSVFEKLSTGKKINRASDDAAMLSIARELEKQVRGFRAAENNIGDALSAIRISDGAASSINDMVQRQRELAIQANNGILNQSQRDALNSEFQQLSQEIDRTAQSANFNGQNVLDGSSPLSDGSGNIQVDPNASSQNQINMPAADLRAASLSIDSLDISNPANISNAISALDSAIKQVNTVRTGQGATYNRLESSLQNAEVNRINTTASLSLAEDMDFAQGVTDRARESILSQSNLAALNNFQSISRNNMMALLNS